jgi:hypothetical protein
MLGQQGLMQTTALNQQGLMQGQLMNQQMMQGILLLLLRT